MEKKKNNNKKISPKTKSSSTHSVTTLRAGRKKNPSVKREQTIPTGPILFNRNKWYGGIIAIVVSVFLLNTMLIMSLMSEQKTAVQKPQEQYWFMLHRKSEKEFLYRGVPGSEKQSKLVRMFTVKTGIPGERPTPLPQLLGKQYWIISSKEAQLDNQETAPYFLTLNIPVPEVEPFGPSPYTECNGEQCNWMLPGAFGLHGTANTPSKLTKEDPGSSGCIRHSDEDITYLYNTLDPKKEEIRYYIEDR